MRQAASPFDAWKAKLLRACCLCSAAIHVVLPPVYSLLVGRPPENASLLVCLGMGSFVLAWTPWPSTGARSAALIAMLLVTSLLGGARFGWAPGIVVLGCALVVVAGLLLGRWGAFAILLLQAGALVAGRVVLPFDGSEPELALLDPTVFSHWVRVAAIFAAIAGGLAWVLRQAVDLIDTALLAGEREIALASRRLEAWRRARAARVLAERELREPQKVQAVARLSGGLAHLLNNALVVVRGALDELAEDLSRSTRSRVEETIVDVTQAVGRAVHGLMAFSRGGETEARSLDVGEELERIVAGLKPTLPDDVTILVRGVPGQRAWIESERLRHMVVNVVLNALDALPGAGEIRLSVQAPGDEDGATWIEVCVEDDGAGMSEGRRVRALEAFFTSKDRERHVGLGLTVAARIAEQAGGALEVDSVLGAGTRVTIRLPRDPSGGDGLGEGRVQLTPALPRAPAQSEDDAQGDGDSPARASYWRRDMTARLARTAAWVVPVVFAVTHVAGVRWRAPHYALFGVGMVWIALAGWRRQLPDGARVGLLSGALILLALDAMAAHSYQMAAPVAGLFAAVVLAALLGSRGSSALVLAIVTATLLWIGWLHAAGTLVADLAPVTLTDPLNWERVALNLTVFDGLLAASVLAILGHVQRGFDTLSEAQHRMRAARAQEDEEAARLLCLERELSRSERLSAAGRVVGTVAHDLNNALQGLIGAAFGLNRPSASQTALQQTVEDLWQCYEHTRALAMRLGGADSPPLEHLEPLDLALEVQRSSSLLRSILPAWIALESDVAPGSFVRIRSCDLRRLLFNLVSNARDAIAGAGAIHITGVQRDGQVVLAVRDTGHGMDQATRKRLFEPFFTTKPAGRGTGLGLHSIACILQQTGGRVRVRSAPGRGTAFVLTWPMAPRPSLPRTVSDASLDHGRARGTVLVVEDEPLVRDFLVRLLEDAGYRVCQASDGAVARRLIEQTPSCEALLIDGVLPGPPAGELIALFGRRHPGRPVVLCSGHLPQELARRGLLIEHVTFLPKPFDPQQLLDRLMARAPEPAVLEAPLSGGGFSGQPMRSKPA